MLKSETIGWTMSAALHVGVVVVAFVGLPDFSRERPLPPPPISIEFVKIDKQTQVVAPKVEEEVQERAVEKQPNYAREEVVAEAPAEAVPLPDQKPVRQVTKPKPKPKPEVTERQKLVARATPRSKPKPPLRLKSSRIAALIDRSIKEEQEEAPKVEEDKEEKVEQKKDEKKPDLFAGLRGTIATASLMDALQQKVYRCWNIPTGAKGVQDMRVDVSVRLSAEGDIVGQPKFLNAGDLNDPSRAFFRVFAESARRAVQLCAPYAEASDYIRETGQNEIIFKFNPREFLGE